MSHSRLSQALTGTPRLIRLALRRDRIQLPIWLLGLSLLTLVQAGEVASLYSTRKDQLAYATTSAGSAVTAAFNGPLGGADLGSITMAEAYFLLAVLIPLMSGFAVVRHTRQNEETGRSELIGAGVVGRQAPLTAALIVGAGAALLLGLLVALGFIAGGLPVAGSLAAGAGYAGIGVVFAGIAAVAAQVTDAARPANGWTAAAMGVAFLLRAVGDATGRAVGGVRLDSNWPSWLSPLGWTSQVRPYTEDNWWVLALFAALFLTTAGTAYALTARRDLGSGLIAARRGPASASPALLSPLGLAWRLQRGVLLGWAAAFVVFGAAFGGIATEVDDFLAANAQASDIITRMGGSTNLVDAFLATTLAFLALAAAGYVTQALLRLRSEETGPLEPVLATAVSRPSWLASHLAVAGGGVVGLLVLGGAGAGLAYGLNSGDPAGQTARLAGLALVQAPAVLVVAGACVLLFALLPRLSAALSWGLVIACLLVYEAGALLDLPQAVIDLSPFAHTPAVPSVALTATPLLALSGVAVAFGAAGMWIFRRRDLRP